MPTTTSLLRRAVPLLLAPVLVACSGGGGATDQASPAVTATASASASGADGSPVVTVPSSDAGTPDPSTSAGAEDGATSGGGTLAQVTPAPDGTLDVELAGPDGSARAYATTTAADVRRGITVGGDGRVVYVDVAGTLTRADADSTAPVRSEGEGPWEVLGPTVDGDVYVLRGSPEELHVLTDTDVVPAPGAPVAPQVESSIVSATGDGDRTVVDVSYAGEGGREWFLYEGGEQRSLYAAGAIEVLDEGIAVTSQRTDPTLVGDELWSVETDPDAGTVDLVVQGLDDGDARRLRLPVDGEEAVSGMTAGTDAEGADVLVLRVTRRGAAPLPALEVDLDAARDAVTADGTDEVPDGVVAELDQTGIVVATG